MSMIFPGNYVAHLNAYREQGVEALPGVEFYKAVGALPLNPDVFTELVNGELPALTDEAVYVLSPDLRQDDKPRKDKSFRDSLLTPLCIARQSLLLVFVKPVAGTTTIVISCWYQCSYFCSLTAEADGYYPVGEFSLFPLWKALLTELLTSAETAVQVTTDAGLIASLDPSAGACRNSPSAILVEVCYYRPDSCSRCRRCSHSLRR